MHTRAALIILGGARAQVFCFASVLAASPLAGSVCTQSSDFLCDSSFPPEVRKEGLEIDGDFEGSGGPSTCQTKRP